MIERPQTVVLAWPFAEFDLFYAESYLAGVEESKVKIYDGASLRNVALVGHGHTGKTQLISALLYTAGMVNRLGKVDTMRRAIYIHGSPGTVEMGTPGSIGCIRMRNDDVLELFDRVSAGTPVQILES